MKRLTYLAITSLLVSCSIISCNNTEDGSSTPIDSTNLHGTAPATYNEDDPANPDHPVYEGSTDTTLKANTISSEDSAKGKR
jgi:hypothetical protein